MTNRRMLIRLSVNNALNEILLLALIIPSIVTSGLALKLFYFMMIKVLCLLCLQIVSVIGVVILVTLCVNYYALPMFLPFVSYGSECAIYS